MQKKDYLKKFTGKTVDVKDGNIEKALSKLKRKLKDLGVLYEYKLRSEFEKPSMKKRKLKLKAIRNEQINRIKNFNSTN